MMAEKRVVILVFFFDMERERGVAFEAVQRMAAVLADHDSGMASAGAENKHMSFAFTLELS